MLLTSEASKQLLKDYVSCCNVGEHAKDVGNLHFRTLVFLIWLSHDQFLMPFWKPTFFGLWLNRSKVTMYALSKK